MCTLQQHAERYKENTIALSNDMELIRDYILTHRVVLWSKRNKYSMGISTQLTNISSQKYPKAMAIQERFEMLLLPPVEKCDTYF